MKALGSHIEGWKHQMNDAGAQAAAVLALVQSDGSEIRYLRWTSRAVYPCRSGTAAAAVLGCFECVLPVS